MKTYLDTVKVTSDIMRPPPKPNAGSGSSELGLEMQRVPSNDGILLHQLDSPMAYKEDLHQRTQSDTSDYRVQRILKKSFVYPTSSENRGNGNGSIPITDRFQESY